MCKHKPPNNFKINCTALLTPPLTEEGIITNKNDLIRRAALYNKIYI